MAPNQDFNLTVLQRIDPFIEDILASAPSTILFQHLPQTGRWGRKDLEGSLFIVKRKAASRFHLIIMNKCSPENLVEDIVEILQCEVKKTFLMYQNKDKDVRGIWFEDSQTCEDVCNVLNRILSIYANTTLKVRSSPTETKSELKETGVAEGIASTSDTADGSHISRAPWSQKSYEENSTNLFLNRGTTERSAPVAQEPEPVPTIMEKPIEPIDFPYSCPSSSMFVPIFSISSPRLEVSAPYAGIVISSQPPPNSGTSQVQNSNNIPIFSKEKVGQALTKLATNDAFVEMVYWEILKAHIL